MGSFCSNPNKVPHKTSQNDSEPQRRRRPITKSPHSSVPMTTNHCADQKVPHATTTTHIRRPIRAHNTMQYYGHGFLHGRNSRYMSRYRGGGESDYYDDEEDYNNQNNTDVPYTDYEYLDSLKDCEYYGYPEPTYGTSTHCSSPKYGNYTHNSDVYRGDLYGYYSPAPVPAPASSPSPKYGYGETSYGNGDYGGNSYCGGYCGGNSYGGGNDNHSLGGGYDSS